jgi:hypothetical protein
MDRRTFFRNKAANQKKQDAKKYYQDDPALSPLVNRRLRQEFAYNQRSEPTKEFIQTNYVKQLLAAKQLSTHKEAKGEKRKHEGEPEAGPSGEPQTKNPTVNENSTVMANNTGDLPMADAPVVARDSGATNSASSGSRGQAPLPLGIRQSGQTYTRTFTRQYKLRIFNELSQRATPTVGGVIYNDFIPPYHDLPVDVLSFYMHPYDIQRLRHHTRVRVLNCDVDVSTHTAIITYETNAAGTQIGNNNLGITLIQLDPFMPRTGESLIPEQATLVQNIFTGSDVNTLPISAVPTADNLGSLSATVVTRNYSNKYRYRTTRAIDAVLPRLHLTAATQITPSQFFPVDRYVIKRENISMTEGHFTSWSYKPKNGLIFARQRGLYAPGTITATTVINPNQKQAVSHRAFQAGNITGPQVTAPGQVNTIAALAVGNYYNDVFENEESNILISIDSSFVNGGGKVEVPHLIIGIEPQVGVNSTNDPPKPIPCHVDLIVTTSIDIEITDGIDYDDSLYPRIDEINYKYPDHRLYTATTGAGPFRILGAPFHSSNPDNNEQAWNSRGIDNTIRTTFAYPQIDKVPTDQDNIDALAKALTERNTAYEEMMKNDQPYFTRAQKKKVDEVLAAVKEVFKKTKRSTTVTNRIEADSDYEDNLN